VGGWALSAGGPTQGTAPTEGQGTCRSSAACHADLREAGHNGPDTGTAVSPPHLLAGFCKTLLPPRPSRLALSAGGQRWNYRPYVNGVESIEAVSEVGMYLVDADGSGYRGGRRMYQSVTGESQRDSWGLQIGQPSCVAPHGICGETRARVYAFLAHRCVSLARHDRSVLCSPQNEHGSEWVSVQVLLVQGQVGSSRCSC
jgi:hypothetical protein